jgi:hypothetical protein
MSLVDIYPHNLNFNFKTCHFCKITFDDEDSTDCLSESRGVGWRFCFSPKCISQAKQSVIAYCNETKSFPIFSVIYDKEKKNHRSLSFYRKRNDSITVGTTFDNYLEWTNLFCHFIDEKLGFNLNFIADGKRIGRFVPLDNIFYHNETFYNEIVESEDLLSSNYKFTLKFTELSEELQQLVHQMKQSANNNKTGQFDK